MFPCTTPFSCVFGAQVLCAQIRFLSMLGRVISLLGPIFLFSRDQIVPFFLFSKSFFLCLGSIVLCSGPFFRFEAFFSLFFLGATISALGPILLFWVSLFLVLGPLLDFSG